MAAGAEERRGLRVMPCRENRPPLHGADRRRIEIDGGMEMQRAVCSEAEHPVGDAAVQRSRHPSERETPAGAGASRVSE